ncbi:hypothetical protein DM860_001004 [Cuscuta australis]|uniref:Uncharacterized protein n=1 Tax=Cuscuta australis TaxID=267555 RepID=A0A328DSR5_9ASTE|nr:hypothetical protein DM860_001004 [Cuscuta australis]
MPPDGRPRRRVMMKPIGLRLRLSTARECGESLWTGGVYGYAFSLVSFLPLTLESTIFIFSQHKILIIQQNITHFGFRLTGVKLDRIPSGGIDLQSSISGYEKGFLVSVLYSCMMEFFHFDTIASSIPYFDL